MRTSRQDVQRNKKQVRCPNSSFIGYSTGTLKYGDLFLYKENYTDGTYSYRLGKCHGQIYPLKKIEHSDVLKWYILTQAANDMMTFTYERWIDPEEVIEICPKDHANINIKNFFLEREDID